MGVDLVMHSATKYLNGHSDVTAGALVGPRALIDRLQPARKLFGGVLEPASAYALARGMKTIAVRVERHNANALRLATWLESDNRIARVYYPGLPSHPDHAIAAGQMRGFGGMICFDVGGGYDRACAVFDRLRVVQRAASLGGTESICSLPVLTSQYGLNDDQLAAAGVTRSMIRLSVGLEHVDDLIADLDQALGDSEARSGFRGSAELRNPLFVLVHFLLRRRFGEELLGQLTDTAGDADAREVAVFRAELVDGNHGLGHGPVAAG